MSATLRRLNNILSMLCPCPRTASWILPCESSIQLHISSTWLGAALSSVNVYVLLVLAGQKASSSTCTRPLIAQGVPSSLPTVCLVILCGNALLPCHSAWWHTLTENFVFQTGGKTSFQDEIRRCCCDFLRPRDCFSCLMELFPSCRYFSCPEWIVNLPGLVSKMVIWTRRGSGAYTSYATLERAFWIKVYIHFCP